MKNIFIAGNWKSNKTPVESMTWLEKQTLQSVLTEDIYKVVTVVILPPFTSLPQMSWYIKEHKTPIHLGAQNLSPYPNGAYTGEVSGFMLKELAEWVIIGHSERRKYFNETDEVLARKVIEAKDVGLHTIYCVPDEKTVVPQGVDVVAYEPVWAIGTGKTDTPENANSVVSAIKKHTNAQIVIYGGSVTSDNVGSFVTQPDISGVLPGGASLDPEKFTKLVASAAASISIRT